jgi:hypothetical protein
VADARDAELNDRLAVAADGLRVVANEAWLAVANEGAHGLGQ